MDKKDINLMCACVCRKTHSDDVECVRNIRDDINEAIFGQNDLLFREFLPHWFPNGSPMQCIYHNIPHILVLFLKTKNSLYWNKGTTKRTKCTQSM